MDVSEHLDAYSQEALSVRLPGDQAGSGRLIRAFEAADFTTSAQDPDGDAAASTSTKVQTREGAVFNCGGHVASLDWAPSPHDAKILFLAIAVHPVDRAHNIVGRPIGGPHLLQIWQIGRGLPNLALALCLHSGLVWDCKWQPGSGHRDRLGLLAVAQGTGKVSILSIPFPEEALLQRDRLSKGKRPAASESAADRLIELAPCASAQPATLSGSLASCVEWLPSAPHDLLLAGCWDGSVACFKLGSAAGSPSGSGINGANGALRLSMELLLHFPASDGPVRGLAWAPAELAGATSDNAHRHLFAVVGHALHLRVWDLRDSFRPALQVGLPQRWRFAVQWLADPAGLLVAEDEGALRWTSLDPFFRKERMPVNSIFEGTNSGAIWSVHTQPGGDLAFYAGDSGEVGMFRIARGDRYVSADAHQCFAGVREEGEQLHVLSTAQAEQKNGLFGSKGSDSAKIKASKQAIHCVRCSAQVQGDQTGHAWLAYGTAQGIVHISRIPWAS